MNSKTNHAPALAHTPDVWLSDALGAIANARRFNQQPIKSALETAADIDGFLSTAVHHLGRVNNDHARLLADKAALVAALERIRRMAARGTIPSQARSHSGLSKAELFEVIEREARAALAAAKD